MSKNKKKEKKTTEQRLHKLEMQANKAIGKAQTLLGKSTWLLAESIDLRNKLIAERGIDSEESVELHEVGRNHRARGVVHGAWTLLDEVWN